MGVDEKADEAEAGSEHRVETRRRVLLSGKLIHSPNDLGVDCAIQDISRTGARVRMSGPEALANPLHLIDLRHGLAFKARIVWRDGARVGLAFTRYYDLSKPDPERPPVLRRIWMEHVR
jgi:hypothetical protein